MDPTAAKALLDSITRATAILQRAYSDLGPRGNPTSEDWHKRLATVIALIGTGFYKPLYKQYPELCPEQMRFYLEAPESPSDWPFGSPAS